MPPLQERARETARIVARLLGEEEEAEAAAPAGDARDRVQPAAAP
jgi:phosphohistidine phosphatase SixA